MKMKKSWRRKLRNTEKSWINLRRDSAINWSLWKLGETIALTFSLLIICLATEVKVFNSFNFSSLSLVEKDTKTLQNDKEVCHYIYEYCLPNKFQSFQTPQGIQRQISGINIEKENSKLSLLEYQAQLENVRKVNEANNSEILLINEERESQRKHIRRKISCLVEQVPKFYITHPLIKFCFWSIEILLNFRWMIWNPMKVTITFKVCWDPEWSTKNWKSIDWWKKI